MSNALNPIPSWLRASAWDAGNMSMRKAGRSKWNLDDWNASAEAQERLIKSCYGRDSDHNDPNLYYTRFVIAERMEREGRFKHKSNLATVMAEIDAVLA